MHKCEYDLPSSSWGPAITECKEINGELWVGNDEYCSQVNFCPFCGYKASIMVYQPKRLNSEGAENSSCDSLNSKNI